MNAVKALFRVLSFPTGLLSEFIERENCSWRSLTRGNFSRSRGFPFSAEELRTRIILSPRIIHTCFFLATQWEHYFNTQRWLPRKDLYFLYFLLCFVLSICNRDRMPSNVGWKRQWTISFWYKLSTFEPLKKMVGRPKSHRGVIMTFLSRFLAHAEKESRESRKIFGEVEKFPNRGQSYQIQTCLNVFGMDLEAITEKKRIQRHSGGKGGRYPFGSA